MSRSPESVLRTSLLRRAWLVGVLAMLVATPSCWAEQGSVQHKAEQAKSQIQDRARAGEDVSDYLERMKEIAAKLRAGERQEGEQLLDQVLSDLRSPAGRLVGVPAKGALTTSSWSKPERVTIRGYNKPGNHKMEVGVSPDGTMLLFNNSNENPTKTDLYYATRVGDKDTLFEFGGAIGGANKPGVLDGTAAVNKGGKFAFVSSRLRPPALHWGWFAEGKARDIEVVPLDLQNGFFALDPETGADWDTLFFAHRRWKDEGYMDIAFAHWNGQRYVMPGNWRKIMANVNTEAKEYAPEVSSDLLELWFTRHTTGPMTIYGATRMNVDEPFTNVGRHPTITGPAEAPTLTADDRVMYYHCMDVSTKTWEICVTRRQ